MSVPRAGVGSPSLRTPTACDANSPGVPSPIVRAGSWYSNLRVSRAGGSFAVAPWLGLSARLEQVPVGAGLYLLSCQSYPESNTKADGSEQHDYENSRTDPAPYTAGMTSIRAFMGFSGVGGLGFHDDEEHQCLVLRKAGEGRGLSDEAADTIEHIAALAV